MGSKKDKIQMVINTIESKLKKNRNGKKHNKSKIHSVYTRRVSKRKQGGSEYIYRDQDANRAKSSSYTSLPLFPRHRPCVYSILTRLPASRSPHLHLAGDRKGRRPSPPPAMDASYRRSGAGGGGGGSAPRTVEDIYKDYRGRRSAILRALTNGKRPPSPPARRLNPKP
jgi:hypothetical protein